MIIPDEYFLSDKFKTNELAKLELEIEKGYVDKEMIPYLEKINKLPGIVSLFCCCGHTKDNGNLLLAISQEVFKNLYSENHNYPISSLPPFDHVSIDFFTEICRINFTWRAKNFKASMNAILEILADGKAYFDKLHDMKDEWLKIHPKS